MTTVGDEFTLSVGEDGEEEKTKENGTTCKPDEGDRHSLNGDNSPSGEALSRDGRLLVASVFIEDALQHRHIGIYHTFLQWMLDLTGLDLRSPQRRKSSTY